MSALVVVLWRTLKLMPQTKPAELKPEANLEVGWEDIAGVDEAKSELREVVDFLREPKQFERLGAKVPKGVLLHGPPGTGKTLLAKAVAHESGAQFFSQSASSFVEMFAGLGAARIRRLFREARKAQPAIIFIDELDAVGARRGSDNNSEREQTLNQLLVEMDGFSSAADGRVVVMAASNLLEKLDPALLRPGRFDRQVFVSPPDVKGRERILRVHTANKPLREDVDLYVVAQQTSGLTGADLANICNEAAIFCGAPPGPRRLARGLRQRAGAGHRRRAVLDHAQRARASRRRLPRGRPRAVPRAARRRRPRPQDLDRPARQRAGLRGQPARRGLLPEDARRARRPDDDPARRPRRRADRLRRGHHRRRQRPAARGGDHPRDDPPVRDGLRRRAAGGAQGAAAVRSHPPHPRRGAARAGLRGAPRRVGSHHHAPRAARPHRHRAAGERDARARADRPHHGGRAAPGAPQADRRPARRGVGEARASRGTRLRAQCSPGSTTSASPSRISTPRSPCTSRSTAWPWRIARSSTSRASRPCCSTSARTTSSCCAR